MLFLIGGMKAEAQVYPVNGNAVLIPPYSVYLSDYTSRTTDRLVLNVVLNDVARPELRVRLRMRIEGQNIKLETKPEYIGSEIILQGGVPLRLNGTDLTEYFNPNNLNFTGITRKEFEKTGALPEGFYTFCFEVLEYNRGVKISNSICAPAWLILNDPPMINIPRNNEKLKPTFPQNLVFQWTPRHTGSPNSAFSTEYDIQMVEVWPSNRNPNDAILTSPPILETTTRSTSFIYGPAETPLELGRRYAFRVKAKSIVGAEEYDLFKNNGYSEVFSFIYGDACDLPGNIRVETGSTKFKIMWDGQFNHSAYNFQYRQAGTTNWYTSNTALNEVNIFSLTPNTTYEYQVAGACGVFEGQYTPIATLKTNEIGEASYSCGLPLETFNLDPAELIPSLKVGDVIQAGDFSVKLATVSGGGGTFTGTGVIEVPFFNKATVKAEFANISVNKEMRMVNGYMNVTGAGVEVIPSGVMNIMDELSQVLSVLDSALTDLENNLPQPFDPYAFVPDEAYTMPGPVTVERNFDGVTVTDRNGVQRQIPPGTEAAIVDDSGKGYLIDSKGKVHEVSSAVAATAANREYNLKLEFTGAPNSLFGFDTKKYDALAGRYDKLDATHFVPYKSVEVGKTDNVVATLEDATLNKSRIRFEMGGAQVPATSFSGSTSTVTVNSRAAGEQEGLIAILAAADTSQRDQVLGRTNVVSYNAINKNLVVVPVNGNSYSLGSAGTLQTALNKIYSQGVVNWSVRIADSITVTGINPFNAGETGMLSNYTDHMRKVINAYKDNMDDKETYFLFLVSNPTDPQLNGFMPRDQQAGFIFKDKHSSEQDIARTMAHELGHGVFNLHHTFMEENFSVPKRTTDNLMDYNGGDRLYKYQWDMMRYPPIVIGLLDSDEEAQYSDSEYFVRLLQLIRCAYIAGNDAIPMPERFRSGGTSEPITFDYGISTPPSEINGFKNRTAYWTVPANQSTLSGIRNAHIDAARGEILIGSFLIKVPVPVYNMNSGLTPFEHFRRYLFPSENNVLSEFMTVWNSGIGTRVQNRQPLLETDFTQLKQVVSCGTKYLDTNARFNLLQAILNYSTTEYYEDLLLDLIQTTPAGAASKDLFEKINSNTQLLDDLLEGMDNPSPVIGGGRERNFDRFAQEYLSLFVRAYSESELTGKYSSISESKQLFFNGFGIGCDWTIEATRSFDNIEFTEKEILSVTPGTYVMGETGASTTRCTTNEASYQIKLTDLVAVNFTAENFLTSKGKTLVMPASVYYILVKSHWNDQTMQLAEGLWTIVGVVTPIDEFYLIGKAIQYGSKGFQALRLVTIKTLALERKISVPLSAEGIALKNSDVEKKLENYVEWVSANSELLSPLAQRFYQAFPNPSEAFVAKFNSLNDTEKLDFLNDFERLNFASSFNNNPRLVDAWRKLLHPDISDAIRKNPTYLGAITKQISNYGDQVAFKFERVLPHVDPNDYGKFFEALNNPKSIDHVRSLVGDFEKIPGISLSEFKSNSLPQEDVLAPATWGDPLLALPGETAITFTGSVTAKTLSPGQKIYRVLSSGQKPSGGFWTYELPRGKAGLFGDTAVRPEWNGATHYVEFTVPEGGLKIWDGPTASQPVLNGIDEVNLPGGGIQIFVPDPYRRLGNEFDNLTLKPIDLK